LTGTALLPVVGRDVAAEAFVVGGVALAPDLVAIRRRSPSLVVGLVVATTPYHHPTDLRTRRWGIVTLRTCRIHASVLRLGSGT